MIDHYAYVSLHTVDSHDFYGYLDLNIKQVNGKQLYLISLDLEQAFSARLVELNLSFSYAKVMTEQLTSIDRIDLDMRSDQSPITKISLV